VQVELALLREAETLECESKHFNFTVQAWSLDFWPN